MRVVVAGPVGPWLRLSVLIIRPVVRFLFRFRYLGMEFIPASGGVIVVANHVSLLDPLLFSRFIWDAGRIPRFLIKDGLFQVPFLGSVLRGAEQIPVSRGTSAAHDALPAAVAALRRGELVIVYPEGTVTRDPQWWPMQGRTGLARLALAVDVPVVPVAQWGPQRSWDYHSKKLRLVPRATAVVQAGPPVDLAAYRLRSVTPELLREMTDEVFSVVRDLLAGLRGELAPAQFGIWPEGGHR